MSLTPACFAGASYTGTGFSGDRTGELIKLSSPGGLTSELLGVNVYSATQGDCDAAVANGKKAAPELAKAILFQPWRLMCFFQYVIEGIRAKASEMAALCELESGIPQGPLLGGEIPRCIVQIMDIIGSLMRNEWYDVVMSRVGIPTRRMRVPLDMVGIVLGPINFILAFGAFGYDLLSMLATGHPVVIKVHENCPLTGELTVRILIDAAKRAGLPDGTITMIQGGPQQVQWLIESPHTGLFGFTGSPAGGKACADHIANHSPCAMLTSFEMSAFNLAFVAPGALNEGTAKALVTGEGVRAGLLCTTTHGVVVIDSPESRAWATNQVAPLVRTAAPQTAFNAAIRDRFGAHYDLLSAIPGVTELARSDARPDETKTQISMIALQADGDTVAANLPAFLTEWYGQGFVFIFAKDPAQATAIFNSVPRGQLSAMTFAGKKPDGSSELCDFPTVAAATRAIGGRCCRDTVAAGILLNPAVFHGGEHSSGDGRFSSVGAEQTRMRWGTTRCEAGTNVDEVNLPPVFQWANPWDIARQHDYQKGVRGSFILA